MVECNSSSGSYTVKYWCPGPIEICESFPGHRSHILGRTPSYFSLVSCSLSVLGSLLIVFSYWRWKDIRTGSRSIVTFMGRRLSQNSRVRRHALKWRCLVKIDRHCSHRTRNLSRLGQKDRCLLNTYMKRVDKSPKSPHIIDVWQTATHDRRLANINT